MKDICMFQAKRRTGKTQIKNKINPRVLYISSQG